jgi:small subunit ribosomal protein S18
VSENEKPKESNESEGRGRRDRGDDDRRGGGGRGGRGGGRGAGGGRGRRRRGKTYYCPKGKCFDYKNLDNLTRFVSESGKIKPRRQTGNCSRCQRELAREVKRARHLALLPFADAN